jgi:hypothetical protein
MISKRLSHKKGPEAQMKATLLLLAIVFPLLVSINACGHSSEPTTAFNATSRLPAETGIFDTPSVRPTGTNGQQIQTILPTPMHNTQELVTRILAPEDRIVPIEDLGLPSQDFILARESSSSQFFIFLPNENWAPLKSSLPSRIESIDIAMSPDHSFVAYSELISSSSGTPAHFDIMLARADGSHATQLMSGLPGGFMLKWDDSGEIVIWWPAGSDLECPEKILLLNPISKSATYLPGAHEYEPYNLTWCFPSPVIAPDGYHAIYLAQELGWRIIDYRSMRIESALSGVDISPGGDKIRIAWLNDGVTLAFPLEREILYGSHLSNSLLAAPDPALVEFAIPEGSNIQGNYIPWWDPALGLAAFNVLNDTRSEKPSIAMVDFAQSIFTDFELSQSDVSTLSGTPGFIVSTRNATILAWPIFQAPENDYAIGSVLLNTLTGKLGVLQGYEVIGFGEFGD